MARHSWQRTAEHNYKCVRDGCPLRFENVGQGSRWQRLWFNADGQCDPFQVDGATPPCTPTPAAPAPRAEGPVPTCTLCGAPGQFYPCGARCGECKPDRSSVGSGFHTRRPVPTLVSEEAQ